MDKRSQGSESEIFHFYLFDFFLLDFFHEFVFCIRFDDNRAHRPYRTDRFASAATDTKVGIDRRNGQRPLEGNHMDSLCRTMFRTGAAIGSFSMHDTPVDKEGGDTDLRGGFLFFCKRFDRSVGADFRAHGTFVITVTVDIGHARLEQIVEAVFHAGRSEHMGGALYHAKMASRAPVFEPFEAEGAGGGDGGPFFGMLLAGLFSLAFG